MGSHYVEPSRQNNVIKCGYCAKIDCHEEDCRKKKNESASTSGQLTNYATNSEYDDYGGLFIMRHSVNSMLAFGPTNTSNLEIAWFVDSSASNHMTSLQEWFRDLQELDCLGYVETKNDDTHPIWHVNDVSFGKDDDPILIYYNNLSSIHLSLNLVFHAQTSISRCTTTSLGNVTL